MQPEDFVVKLVKSCIDTVDALVGWNGASALEIKELIDNEPIPSRKFEKMKSFLETQTSFLLASSQPNSRVKDALEIIAAVSLILDSEAVKRQRYERRHGLLTDFDSTFSWDRHAVLDGFKRRLEVKWYEHLPYHNEARRQELRQSMIREANEKSREVQKLDREIRAQNERIKRDRDEMKKRMEAVRKRNAENLRRKGIEEENRRRITLRDQYVREAKERQAKQEEIKRECSAMEDEYRKRTQDIRDQLNAMKAELVRKRTDDLSKLASQRKREKSGKWKREKEMKEAIEGLRLQIAREKTRIKNDESTAAAGTKAIDDEMKRRKEEREAENRENERKNREFQRLVDQYNAFKGEKEREEAEMDTEFKDKKRRIHAIVDGIGHIDIERIRDEVEEARNLGRIHVTLAKELLEFAVAVRVSRGEDERTARREVIHALARIRPDLIIPRNK